MSKPILYYVLINKWHYGRETRFSVLGVTSEKGGQVYGRDETDRVTHVARLDVIHRFEPGTSLEWAKAAGERAENASKLFDVPLQQARAEVSRLEDARRAATLAAAKLSEKPPAPPPEPPYPATSRDDNNAKRAGWNAFLDGRSRESCPFPRAMPSLHNAFREGWDAARRTMAAQP